MDRFNFDEEYENLLLACMSRRQKELSYLAPLIKSSYFSGVLSTVTARVMLEYFTKYARFPTFVVLGQLLKEKMADRPDERETCQAYVEKLSKMVTQDWEHVRDSLVAFCRQRAVIAAVRTSIVELKERKEPGEELVRRFQEAVQVGENMEDLGIILHRDYKEVVAKVTSQQYGIATGFPALDRIWKHGWGPGWLIVPLAPPKRFKTLTCLNLALNMCGPLIGRDVIYYACEIDQEKAAIRVMCNMAGLPEDYMHDSKEKFIEVVGRKMQNICGNFVFKTFSSHAATIPAIRAHARAVINQYDLHPGAVFIDYAETVLPEDSKATDPRQQASIYIGARALGKELGCPVIMPDRCNKETVDQAVPNMKSFQGAFQKAGIVDIAFGLCATEIEYQNNVLRLFTFLDRHAEAFKHVMGRVDPQIGRVEFSKDIPYNPGEAVRERQSRTKGLPAELLDAV